MELRCAKNVMLFLEIAGPSVEGVFAVTELPYLQKKEVFVIRCLNLSKPQECEHGSI
jgi:hypothetical protein